VLVGPAVAVVVTVITGYCAAGGGGRVLVVVVVVVPGSLDGWQGSAGQSSPTQVELWFWLVPRFSCC
jgi:hypothetical protein